MQGWIKLHRQITEHEFYFSERFTKVQAWIDLLLLANHKRATVFIRGVEIDLNPGELCYSQLSLAKRWRWNPRTANKFLTWLEKHEMIHNRISRVTTVISIRNWSLYQQSAEQSAEQNAERIHNRVHTDKNDKNVKNENTTTFEGEVFIFKNELLKITAKQLKEMKTSYPAIKKFHPQFTLCSDMMLEKQRKGQVIGSPSAFLHSHLRREQEKLTDPKHNIQQTWGPGTRSGGSLSFEQIMGKIAAHAEPGRDNGQE